MNGLRPVVALAIREFRTQVTSPIAWSVAAAFTLLAGYGFFRRVSWMVEFQGRWETSAAALNLNDAVAFGTFRQCMVLVLLLVPILTMRSLAEERTRGTDELLLTAPIGAGQLIAGKFAGLAAVVLGVVIVGCSPVLWLYWLGAPESGPIAGGYLAVILVALAMAAVGLAASSVTASQSVAAAIALGVGLALYAVDGAGRGFANALAPIARHVSLPGRFDPMARGLIDLRDVVFFLSLMAIGLFVARAVVATRRET